MDRFELVNAMLSRRYVKVAGICKAGGHKVVEGFINGIAMEDGSGYNFLVTVAPALVGTETLFVRCRKG